MMLRPAFGRGRLVGINMLSHQLHLDCDVIRKACAVSSPSPSVELVVYHGTIAIIAMPHQLLPAIAVRPCCIRTGSI